MVRRGGKEGERGEKGRSAEGEDWVRVELLEMKMASWGDARGNEGVRRRGRSGWSGSVAVEYEIVV